MVVLAGGAASRFPGKLWADVGGIPLLERVVRNLAPASDQFFLSVGPAFNSVGPAFNSVGSAFSVSFAQQLGVRIVVDQQPGGGPLGGLMTTLPLVAAPWVFVAAGDAPFVDVALVAQLCRERREGDEAVVPLHGIGVDQRIEPLAALYRRDASLREGHRILTAERSSFHALLERLRVHYLRFAPDDRVFANLNTPRDHARFLREIC